jgi:hypothetical protein
MPNAGSVSWAVEFARRDIFSARTARLHCGGESIDSAAIFVAGFLPEHFN